MLNYPIIYINTSQVKISKWSKDGHEAHFWPPYTNSKPKMYMKHDMNILFIFSI